MTYRNNYNNAPAVVDETAIIAKREEFERIAVNDEVRKSFEREKGFFSMVIKGNNMLANMFAGNPQPFLEAFLQLSSTGLSLNPVKKHAYLVPRGGKVSLDISYLGIVHAAINSGLEFVQASVVYEKDNFQINGIDKEPTHEYNPFDKNRGDRVGAYCVAKLDNGAFLTEVMSIDEINEIKKVSKSANSKSSPWNTFPDEMIKKTVIKRASKLWPVKNTALQEVINNDNEQHGIDFERQNKQEQVERKEQREEKLLQQKKDREEKEKIINDIKLASAESTTGLSNDEKISFMNSVLKVKNFNDLYKKTNKELGNVLSDITQ